MEIERARSLLRNIEDIKTLSNDIKNQNAVN
jgi:hypothetical protein